MTQSRSRRRPKSIALDKAQEILLSFGVTAVGSMSTSMDDWNAFRRAGDAGR